MTTKTMLLLTLLLATSCQEPDSVLLVGLSCDPNAAPAYSIQVCLSEPSNIDDTKTFPAIPSDQPLAFPTTMALVIPRSHSGSIDLAFLALGTTSRATAHATSQVTLEEGAQDTVKVKLIAGDETCGNGIVDPGEGCDDGNLFSFDGCDDNCQLEPASTAGPPDAGTSSHPDAAPAIPPQPDALPAQSPDAIRKPGDYGWGRCCWAGGTEPRRMIGLAATTRSTSLVNAAMRVLEADAMEASTGTSTAGWMTLPSLTTMIKWAVTLLESWESMIDTEARTPSAKATTLSRRVVYVFWMVAMIRVPFMDCLACGGRLDEKVKN